MKIGNLVELYFKMFFIVTSFKILTGNLSHVDALLIGAHIVLTHWGPVTHICVNELTIISPYNGLSPGRHQAIIWTNAEILLNDPSEQTSMKS